MIFTLPCLLGISTLYKVQIKLYLLLFTKLVQIKLSVCNILKHDPPNEDFICKKGLNPFLVLWRKSGFFVKLCMSSGGKEN